MFYTADSLQSQELNGLPLSSSEMKTLLKTYTNFTNEALTNSMIDLRINLVHTQMVSDIPECVFWSRRTLFAEVRANP